ncbi:MAG: hypothetical protein JST48_05405 [Bacteroidetes bacterium]|nr:hypothetical protein [Bacteroidota bacterium]
MSATKPRQAHKIIGLLAVVFSCTVAQAQDQRAQWESQADTLLNHQDFLGAAALYTKVIEASQLKEKEDYKILYKRALSYYSAEDLDRALADVTRYINEFPENPKPRILRALIYRHKEDIDNQLIDLQKAIELGNTNPQLVYWRGSLLLSKNEFENAITDFLFSKKFNDDAEVETNLALAYRSIGKADSALICLNNAIVLDVNFVTAYVYASAFCVEDENYGLALKYANLALRVDSNNSAALLYKGMALVQSKKMDEGCRCLRKAFDAGEDDAEDYLKEFCFDAD